METLILADGVDLGLPESEKDHPGDGSFSKKYGDRTADYGGPAHRQSGRPPSHWRNFAHWVSLSFKIGKHLEGKALRACLLLRTYTVGQPTYPVEPTVVYFEQGGKRKKIGQVTIPAGDIWRQVELPLPADVKGGAFRIRINDSANIKAGDNYYGKSLSYLKIVCQEG